MINEISGLEALIQDNLLTEAFSADIPAWFLDKLKTDSDLRKSLSSEGIDLSNLKFIDGVFVNKEGDSNKIPVYLINDVYRKFIYIPGYYNNALYITINGRNRTVSKLSNSSIKSHCVQYGYIDTSADGTLNYSIRKSRSAAKSGSINRDLNKGQKKVVVAPRYSVSTWRDSDRKSFDIDDELSIIYKTDKDYDKSGYKINTNELVRRLNELNAKDPARIIKKYSAILNDAKSVISKAILDHDILDNQSNYDNNGWASSKLRLLRDALNQLEDASQDLIRIDGVAKKLESGRMDNERAIELIADYAGTLKTRVERLNKYKISLQQDKKLGESIDDFICESSDNNEFIQFDDQVKEFLKSKIEQLTKDDIQSVFNDAWDDDLDPRAIFRMKQIMLGAGIDMDGIITGYILDDSTNKCIDDVVEVVVKSGNTAICSGCFNGNRQLKSVELPASMQVIGERAFMDCRNLKSINLPDGIVEIQNSAFEGCYHITLIKLPNTLKRFGKEVFYRCSKKLHVICKNQKLKDYLTYLGIKVV